MCFSRNTYFSTLRVLNMNKCHKRHFSGLKRIRQMVESQCMRMTKQDNADKIKNYIQEIIINCSLSNPSWIWVKSKKLLKSRRDFGEKKQL